MSVPRSLSVLGCREMRLGKEPEPSGSVKKSRYASQVVLGLGSPNVSASSTSFRPQQVPLVPTYASSLGENDFRTMTDEQMWGCQSQCLNAVRLGFVLMSFNCPVCPVIVACLMLTFYFSQMVGIRNAQMVRFQAMSREICEKTATLELRRNCIKECETELEQQQDELRNLRSGQSTVRIEVDRLK